MKRLRADNDDDNDFEYDTDGDDNGDTCQVCATFKHFRPLLVRDGQ